MKLFQRNIFSVVACFLVGTASPGSAARFLMSGPLALETELAPESYVIEVTDAELINEARNHLNSIVSIPEQPRGYLIPRVRIASGGDGFNLNYAEPGHPPWEWHATELIEWMYYLPSSTGPIETVPNRDGSPSSVTGLLSENPPIEEMALINYPLAMELSGDQGSNIINVSTRGAVESGEAIMIVGFIVQGEAPRNVVVRALGPSLKDYGIVNPLEDPQIAIFRGTEKIAENDNWKLGNFVPKSQVFVVPPPPQPWFAWLFPTDDRESAVQLSLMPGAYTIQASGADNTTGMALVEVFDMDDLNP